VFIQNIKAAEKITGVQNVSVTSETGHIRIFATTSEACHQARTILEYVEEKYPVFRNQVGRIVGKNFSNIHVIETASSVVRIRVEDEKEKDQAPAKRALSNLKETKKPEAPKKTGPKPPRPQSASTGGNSYEFGGAWADAVDELDTDFTGTGGKSQIINLLIVGTTANVQQARTLLDGHMEHLRKLSMMVDEEKSAATRLAELAGTSGYSTRPGGRGGRPRTAGGNYNNNNNGEPRSQRGPKREGAKKERKERQPKGETTTKKESKELSPKKERREGGKKESSEKKANPAASPKPESGKKESAKKDPSAKKEKKPKKERKENAKKDDTSNDEGAAAATPASPAGDKPRKNRPKPALAPGSVAAKKAAEAEAAAVAGGGATTATDGNDTKRDTSGDKVTKASSPSASSTPRTQNATPTNKKGGNESKTNANGKPASSPTVAAAASSNDDKKEVAKAASPVAAKKDEVDADE
jgi:hypothetical protein